MTEREYLESTPESADERRLHGSRLTDNDEARMRAAIRDYYDRLRGRKAPGTFEVPGDQIEAMRRLAAAAIGCGLVDLRDVEVDWIDQAVAAEISPF